jgi:hypothetical protein
MLPVSVRHLQEKFALIYKKKAKQFTVVSLLFCISFVEDLICRGSITIGLRFI